MDALPLTFSVAGEAELDTLFGLYADLGGDESPLERARLATAFGEVRANPYADVWLAQHDGTTVGTFILFILPALGARCRPLAIVEDVVVDERRRGQGIGRVMMEFAMQRAREANCYKLMLSSNERRTAAHAFYESLGFKRHGYSFLLEL
jgi:GNAT superfamily N-acetyltransferase